MNQVKSIWICACIARWLGLPVPDFAILKLDVAMFRQWRGYQENPVPEIVTDFNQYVFASLDAEGCKDVVDPKFDLLHIDKVLLAKVFLFDRLIRNTDRTDFNSNLLVNGHVCIIDHNNAFDSGFSAGEFGADHVLRAYRNAMTERNKADSMPPPQLWYNGGKQRRFAMTMYKTGGAVLFAAVILAAGTATADVSVSGTGASVSAINSEAGDSDEIYVNVADGTVITGDAAFTASTVHFVCTGDSSMTVHADNAAAFDFGGSGTLAIVYDGTLPSVSGNVFTATTVPAYVTDATKWTGTIWLNNIAVTDFTVNTYGNESSVVRLSAISGWLSAPGNYAFTNSVPVELAGTLILNNGNSANDSNPNRCTVFKKVFGSGTINTDSTADRVVVVIQDASEFTGSLGLSSGKFIVFGQAMPDYTTIIKSATVGQVFVTEGAVVTNSGFWWATGGITVDGELRASNLNKFGGGTHITTTDNGVFTLTSTGNGTEGETDTDYARITGTGSLKYDGTGWRALSTNNYPTAMTLINEQTGDILLSRALTYTVGSLAGSQNLQGNYGSGSRYLRVLQAKDTEWSGTIAYDYYDRFKGIIVAPGVSSAETLTLSGKEEYSRSLTVESGAKVALTGMWCGPVEVSGRLSGGGTIDGSLALLDGAALDASSGAFAVSGALSASGTVKVELPEGASFPAVVARAAGGSGAVSAEFEVYVGGERSRKVHAVVSGGVLKVARNTFCIRMK